MTTTPSASATIQSPLRTSASPIRSGTSTSPGPVGRPPCGVETAGEDGQLEGRQPLQVSHEAVDDDCSQADAHGLGSGELSEVGPLAGALGHEDLPGGRLLERGKDGGDGPRGAARGDGRAGDGPCTV